jgi:hypothetical protein
VLDFSLVGQGKIPTQNQSDIRLRSTRRKGNFGMLLARKRSDMTYPLKTAVITNTPSASLRSRLFDEVR